MEIRKIGVVGASGAGKSSIIVALFAIVPIDRGAIRLDGLAMSDVGLERWRRALAPCRRPACG